LIDYKNLARVRREAENLLILVDELDKRGVPKEIIVNMIVNESEKPVKKNEYPKQDKQT
jgi:hypothetical protein